MGILNIHQAEREGSRMVIGLAGQSGSGKTCTALHLAYGMANYDSSKVGMLDAENKRGGLFADTLKDDAGVVQPFLIGDLVPPFTPARYTTAIKEFEAAGVEVLIVDSVTHEWEGTGGCAEIAEAFIGGNAKRTALGWANAKRDHKKLINALLQCDMDIICCVRAREQTSFKNPNKPVSLGLKPIQEKNFMFEMTVSLMMEDEGMKQTSLKCPGDLKKYFGRGSGYITSQDGKALRDWVDGGSKVDKEKLRFENRLLMNAEKGLAHTVKCWNMTPEEIKTAIGQGFKDKLFASAKGYDDLAEKSAPVIESDANDALKPAPEQCHEVIKDKTETPNPLHQTAAWKKYADARDIDPVFATTMPEPTTEDQCEKAAALIGKNIDQNLA